MLIDYECYSVYRYYILRKDMVAYYVNDIVERLSKAPEIGMWEVRFVSFRLASLFTFLVHLN